ncbi:BPSS1780 family membrane protein [Candidatus Symbiobacter mobilis]|uniref:Transmembrane protein n=1 Tax=Candidatus Symbiobacter mobilis CR TaxID=946483 RepID=U5N8A3_9BURK|nr:BPSS1780 family membrane protein [Candidatus Symbiobacter mobilis]AGX87632.1 hypothetical protein Cenrod_1547 [Candidatus Symbiobacter mobilis CR]
MKLGLVPAGTGLIWVRMGVLTVARHPATWMMLFLLFMAWMSLLTLLPWLGVPLAMAMLPGATLGLMVAARTLHEGAMPTLTTLFCGFVPASPATPGIWGIGLAYAAGALLAIGASSFVDGGQFAEVYLGNASPNADTPLFPAMWVFIALHIPLSWMTWHAPALVYWHRLPVAKSLFFSLVACARNVSAFLVFGLAWMGIMVLTITVLQLLGSMLGLAEPVRMLAFPALLLVASMFFCSLYFSYRDCFPQQTTGEWVVN